MARTHPRENTSEARIKIEDAFWDLLKQHPFDHITVSMITGKAGCNRGSFYYHFVDKYDLADKLIQQELFGDDRFPRAVIAVHTATDYDAIREQLFDVWSDRIVLFMKQSDDALVRSHMREYVFSRWQNILHPDGTSLSIASQFIISYTIEAMLEILVLINDPAIDRDNLPIDFLQEILTFSLTNLGHAEGLSENEIMNRIQQFSESTW